MINKRHIWTAEDDARLTELYSDNNTREIAETMGMRYGQIVSRANVLGLKKSEAFFKSEKSGQLLTGTQKGMSYRFAKGLTPWNKGQKMPAEIVERMKPTMFPKGNLPHNTLQDGAITLRKDNRGVLYKHIRIGLGKWQYLHVKLWIDANGPVPSGHVIAFKDNNPMNTELANLECISKRDNMLRNSIQRYPAELKQAIRTHSRLKRTITSITNNNNDNG